jgi:ribonuclease Z
MEKIKITFLGTSGAIPTKARNHSAILLSYKAENILIDCGEGTQRQFKLAKINPCKLTRILITHWHADHFLGLPGLFQTLAMSEYNKTLQIYGPKNSEEYMSKIKALVNIEIPLQVHEATNKTILDTEGFAIETKSMSHGKPANAYAFTIKDKRRLDKTKIKKHNLPMSSLLKNLQQGKSIKFKNKTISPAQVSYIEKGRKITFILDTSPNKNAPLLAKNSDLLISESSFSNADKAQAEKFKHLTAKDAANIAKSSKSKQLILTHISQRYANPAILLKEAKSVFPKTTIAKDLDTITL